MKIEFKLVVKNETNTNSLNLSYEDSCKIYSKNLLDENLKAFSCIGNPKSLFAEVEIQITPTMSLFIYIIIK